MWGTRWGFASNFTTVYRGGNYWLARLPGTENHLRIRRNVDLLWAPGDPAGERFAYPEHAQHGLLLELDAEDAVVLDRLRKLPALKHLPTSARREGSG
jgi:hypothetical protein